VTQPQPSSSAPPAESVSDRVDSWKEIARYLKRDESTVQRWEKREGMPVHRHLHDKRGSVYAFKSELDSWWQSRRQQLEQTVSATPDAAAERRAPDSETTAPAPERRWRWVAIAAAGGLFAVGLVAFEWLPLSSTSSVRSTNPLVRLTSTSGLNIDPALSPDGTLLAYASDRGGRDDLDIWVQPTTGEKPTRVTDTPGDEVEPSFAPDGAALVFVKAETGGIYTVGAVGGEPRLLASAMRAHTPRFSPDGQWVTYWTGLPAWVLSTGPVRSTGALFVVATVGGAPRALAADFADGRHPVWSPDGEKILFLGESNRDPAQSAFDWYVVSRTGGTPVRTGASDALRAAGVTGLPIPAAWDKNGVTFTTYDEGPSNVWRLAVSEATSRVTGAPVRLTLGTAIERSPSVSSSGRVAFTSVVENVDVWRLPLDPRTGLARGPLERVTDSAAADRIMNLSDDGRTMVFSSSRTGQDEIWIRDPQSGRERQITVSNSPLGRVSHDGALIAVSRGRAGDAFDVMPLTGGTPSALCDNCRITDWSPDGSRVLLRQSQTRLVVRERGSGREVELTSHPSWPLNQARFSPDGAWVVFHVANTPSLRQVYAVPAAATSPVSVEDWIPIVTDFGMQPSWSADGSGVYHFSLRDGAFCAWLQRVDPATKRPVGAPAAVQHFHQPRLRAVAAAAGTNHVAAGYFYVTLTESSANIWMLNQ
jgi:Tol biopolymer transport system component